MLMYPCPHCRADFDSFDARRRHISVAHHETHPEHKFRCTTCDEAFMADMTWLRDADAPTT